MSYFSHRTKFVHAVMCYVYIYTPLLKVEQFIVNSFMRVCAKATFTKKDNSLSGTLSCNFANKNNISKSSFFNFKLLLCSCIKWTDFEQKKIEICINYHYVSTNMLFVFLAFLSHVNGDNANCTHSCTLVPVSVLLCDICHRICSLCWADSRCLFTSVITTLWMTLDHSASLSLNSAASSVK